MTEHEAIKEFEERLAITDYRGNIPKCYEAMELSVNDMKEVQKYRAIGTLEELNSLIAQSEEEFNMLIEYISIGTVEECRVAVEKQNAKKPKEYEDKFYGCPTCGNILLHKWEKYPTKLMDKKNGLPYCFGCGQKLDWSDEE